MKFTIRDIIYATAIVAMACALYHQQSAINGLRADDKQIFEHEAQSAMRMQTRIWEWDKRMRRHERRLDQAEDCISELWQRQ